MDASITAGIVAGLFTILAFAPIIQSIRQQKLRPHRTSWFIWSSTYIVILAQQLSSNAGPIAIRTSVSAAIAVYIFTYAVRHQVYPFHRKTVYPMALIVLASMYASFIASPLQSVLIMTAISSAAIVPMAIKVYADPRSESLTLILANGIASVFALLSLGRNPSIPKLVFPVFVLAATTGLILTVIIRRGYWKRRPTVQAAKDTYSHVRTSYSLQGFRREIDDSSMVE